MPLWMLKMIRREGGRSVDEDEDNENDDVWPSRVSLQEDKEIEKEGKSNIGSADDEPPLDFEDRAGERGRRLEKEEEETKNE